MEEIKLWEIQEDKVSQINKQPLDFEKRLENWLIHDISILSSDLAVIGSQITTPYKKIIDILAINSTGEIIIIELKRDKTYREVIAQVLDYATWVKELSYDDLNDLYNNDNTTEIKKDIGDLYSKTFNKDAEKLEIKSNPKMLIVGSEIDDSTFRIISYLNEFSININAINFNYFQDSSGREFLAQAFIMPKGNITEESNNQKTKRAKSIVKELFNQSKLKIGDKVFFKPALENGIAKTDQRIYAEIVNTDIDCLQRLPDTKTYSFSNLRKIISKELSLNHVKYDWGFGIRFDWVNENEKTLLELLEQ